MIVRIDPQSPEPLFEQIVFAVKEGVARGTLKTGDRLPSVRELAQDLTINPNTVVRAYDVLDREGLVVRRQGAGCFISGRATILNDRERRRQLAGLVQRTVTEAFHLGFDLDHVRAAFEQALAQVRFEEGGEPCRRAGQ